MNREEIIIQAYLLIEEISEGNIKKESLKEDDIILNIGLDSLKYAQLMLGLEEYTGKFADENSINWAQIKTISDLVGIFL